MKHSLRTLLVVCAAAAVATSNAANLAGIDVIVKKDGKTVSRARTDNSGNFATANLEPGSYNVEFRAQNASALRGQQLAITVAAGKQKPRQATASGKHLGGGVAIAMEVPKSAKLSGRIIRTRAEVAQATIKVPEGMEAVKANVKVINGKQHVWVPAPIGSNMGGRWVEAGTEGAALSTSNRKGGDGQVLRSVQDQSSNVGHMHDGFGSRRP